MEPQWSFGERNVVVYSLSHLRLFRDAMDCSTPDSCLHFPCFFFFLLQVMFYFFFFSFLHFPLKQIQSCLLRWNCQINLSSLHLTSLTFLGSLSTLPSSGSFPEVILCTMCQVIGSFCFQVTVLQWIFRLLPIDYWSPCPVTFCVSHHPVMWWNYYHMTDMPRYSREKTCIV